MSEKSNKKLTRTESMRNEMKNKIAGKESSPVSKLLNVHNLEKEKEENEPVQKKTETTNRKKRTKKTEQKSTNLIDQLEELEVDFEETSDHFWDELAHGDPSRNRNKVLTTFYLDPDLHDIIDVIYNHMGKGSKSKLINESIRFSLKSKGLLK